MIGPELLWVTLAALGAGLIESIAGGGGLLLVPALFAVYPTAPPATLFGTNKAGAIWGTAWAAARYSRRVRLAWHALGPACGAAWLGAMAGAWLVTKIDPQSLRCALPGMLVAVLGYTLMHKNLGLGHAPRWQGRAERWVCSAIGALMGLYDGLFGPGTGTFLVFLLVRGLGYDFLHAAAAAKTLNTMTNLSALVFFAARGHVWWPIALVMAGAHLVGSLVGTGLAFRLGPSFVRRVFIGIVAALIMKTSWDSFSPLLYQ
jgi:uncharacterized membrane protein YfcA